MKYDLINQHLWILKTWIVLQAIWLFIASMINKTLLYSCMGPSASEDHYLPPPPSSNKVPPEATQWTYSYKLQTGVFVLNNISNNNNNNNNVVKSLKLYKRSIPFAFH